LRREKTVENYLTAQVEKLGGACEKHTNPGHRGDPDRLVSFPNKYRCMVETKWAEDATPEDHQLRRHEWWRKRGMDVFVLKSKPAVDVWIFSMIGRGAERV
jgi:hypothetical protein